LNGQKNQGNLVLIRQLAPIQRRGQLTLVNRNDTINQEIVEAMADEGAAVAAMTMVVVSSRLWKRLPG
jgi:hypothetical protein